MKAMISATDRPWIRRVRNGLVGVGSTLLTLLVASNPLYGQESDCAGPVEEGGSVAGKVSAEGDISLPGAEVVVRWSEGGAVEPGRITVATDRSGAFSICGLPTGVELQLRARGLGRAGPEVSVTLDPGVQVTQDLRITLGGGQQTRRRGSVTALVGRVLGPDDVGPLPEARVAVGGDTVSTDEQGEFRIEAPSTGEQRLSISHHEFGSRDTTISLSSGATLHTVVQLGETSRVMAPIVVTVRDSRLVGTGYYERLERGLGYYITPEMLERRQPSQLHQMFRVVPGVRVERLCRGTNCTYWPVMTGAAPRTGPAGRSLNDACLPEVYLNGNRYDTDPVRGVNEFNPSGVLAIEVYRGASEVPGVYSGSDARCGVIAIWAK